MNSILNNLSQITENTKTTEPTQQQVTDAIATFLTKRTYYKYEGETKFDTGFKDQKKIFQAMTEASATKLTEGCNQGPEAGAAYGCCAGIFMPAGPEPPFPPRGGKIYQNDGLSDTITSSRQNSLNNNTNNLSSENLISQSNFDQQTSTENTSDQFDSKSKNIFSNSNTQSPDNFNDTQSPYQFTYQPINQFQSQFFNQFNVNERKRDIKEQHKAEVKNGKVHCNGCKQPYHKLNSINFCHNCQKIYDAVTSFVIQAGGTFKFEPKKTIIKLECGRGHTWETDFKTKQVKKWCKACQKAEKCKRKDKQREIQEKTRQEYERIQKELFQKDKHDKNTDTYETTYQNFTFNFQEPEQQYYARRSNEFFAFLLGDEEETKTFDQQVMNQAVEFILDTAETELVYFFQSIEKSKRAKIYRRLARIIHPDKNSHRNAKEAFQRLSQSLRLLQLSFTFGEIFQNVTELFDLNKLLQAFA